LDGFFCPEEHLVFNTMKIIGVIRADLPEGGVLVISGYLHLPDRPKIGEIIRLPEGDESKSPLDLIASFSFDVVKSEFAFAEPQKFVPLIELYSARGPRIHSLKAWETLHHMAQLLFKEGAQYYYDDKEWKTLPLNHLDVPRKMLVGLK
jgi:hypothetical protein